MAHWRWIFTGGNEKIIHTQFGAQRVKDAVVDRFRDRFGRRPSVDLEQPDVRINAHLHRDIASVSLDLSGDSLHQRGYRTAGVAAPLKENLAAALLLKWRLAGDCRTGWGVRGSDVRFRHARHRSRADAATWHLACCGHDGDSAAGAGMTRNSGYTCCGKRASAATPAGIQFLRFLV